MKNAMDFGLSVVTSAARKHRPRLHIAVGQGQGRARSRAQQLDPQPDKIERANPFQHREQRGRGQNQRTQTGQRQAHRDEIAQSDTAGRRDGNPLTLAERIGQHQKDGGAGDQQQGGRCRDEGQPEIKTHMRLSYWVSCPRKHTTRNRVQLFDNLRIARFG